MKRLLTILLSGLLILSLAACGGGGGEQSGNDPLTRDDGGTQQTQGGTENSGNTAPDIDFGAIMAGNGATDTVWGQQDAATRQAILDAAKEDGLDASFGADGSLTIKDPESGETYVQKPDGTWTFQSEDGGEAQLGGNWPDNEFTKLLPKPGFALMAANTDDTPTRGSPGWSPGSGTISTGCSKTAATGRSTGYWSNPSPASPEIPRNISSTFGSCCGWGYLSSLKRRTSTPVR